MPYLLILKKRQNLKLQIIRGAFWLTKFNRVNRAVKLHRQRNIGADQIAQMYRLIGACVAWDRACQRPFVEGVAQL